MNENPTWLLDFRSNVYSQSGEDGVIEKILEVIDTLDGWCVEFGALDGQRMSNTRNLIQNRKYSAVLIEGNKKFFRSLQNNYSDNQNVITLNKLVGFNREDSLDTILADTSIPKNYDFLSIDIDGNDYHVWNAAQVYRPKIVCIEFNPTIPTEVEFVQDADMNVSQGSSLKSLVKLAKKKCYQLVCVVGVNAFFVSDEYFSLFKIQNNDIHILRTDTSKVTYLFTGYDGKVFIRGYGKMPWHLRLPMKESRMQRIPWILRNFPGNYNLPELLIFGFYLLITSPVILFSELRKRLVK